MNYYGQPAPMMQQSAFYGQVQGPVAELPMNSTSPLIPPKQPFIRWVRRRMNIVPVFLGIFVPWGLFAGVLAAISFSLHYDHTTIMDIIVAGAFIATLVVGGFAFQSRFRGKGEREPNWYGFLFLAMLLAFLAACYAGRLIYQGYMLGYYDMQNLSHYTDVYPTRIRGQQVMDAGYIVFTNGTFVDTKKSMGFKNVDIFCVAPIALGNKTMETYDFWAVGKNCCDGQQADFHCDGFNDAKAKSGLRLMSDKDRPYYRLAVQQAEATYKIKAVHPLFFEWTHDAPEKLDGWEENARRDYLIYVTSYFVFQLFLVLCATVAFSKLGAN